MSAVSTIIKRNSLLGNLIECISSLDKVVRNFLVGLPESGKFCLFTRGLFLAMNISSIQFKTFRYVIWVTSSGVQMFLFRGQPFQEKILLILTSLVRNCHFELIGWFEAITGPIIKPLLSCIGPLAIPYVKNITDIFLTISKPVENALYHTLSFLSTRRDFVKKIPILSVAYEWFEVSFRARIVLF